MYKKLVLAGLFFGANSFLVADLKVDPNEFNNMVETCMDLQVEGKLPGVGSNIDSNMIFKSDSINISTDTASNYPLTSNCIVDEQKEKHSFVFIKKSQEANWILAQN